MIGYIVGLIMAFVTMILMPVLSISVSAIVLRVLSDRKSLDWYRSRQKVVDCAIDTISLLLPVTLGFVLLRFIAEYMIGPFLQLDAESILFLAGGLTVILAIVTLASAIAGHRMRCHALQSRILE